MTRAFGTSLDTVSARARGIMKTVKKGQLVRIRQNNNWETPSGYGIVLSRTYLAYESKNCKWKVLTGTGDIRDVIEVNLFPSAQWHEIG